MTPTQPPDNEGRPDGSGGSEEHPEDGAAGGSSPTLPELKTVAELLRMPVSDLDDLMTERSKPTDTLVDVAERHMLGREIAKVLPSVFAGVDDEAMEDVRAAFRWRRLERGEVLFEEGADADGVYVVAAGRLQARVLSHDGVSRPVGEILPGETVGEMAVTTGRPRGATVVALRSSALYECDREEFLALVNRHPVLGDHLFRVLARRLDRANRNAAPVAQRLSVAVVPLDDRLAPSAFVAPFIDALAGAGSVLRLDQSEVERRLSRALSEADERLAELRLLPWFEEQESAHDFVLYQAEPELSTWTRRCLSRADRIILLADADSDPSLARIEQEMERVLEGARPPIHLVLVHPSDRDRPRGTPRWLADRTVHMHHHVRRGRRSDVERIFRLMTGRALGLALSGGGARGFAHIGVFQAFEELGIPIDAIGGTSAGAAMGGQYAMGLTPPEIREVCRRNMVDRQPFKEYTLPIYSFVKRDSLDDVLKTIADGRDVTDLWIPFFAVSADLHTGEKVIHREGPLWKAARASISLPGIVPPVIDGDRLLVDGGVLDNLPETEVAEFCGGRVVAVDVSGGSPVPLDYTYEELPSPWAVLWNRILPWRRSVRVPTLIDVILRTATVSNTGQLATRETVDLLVEPPVSEFGLLAFEEIDRIVDVSAAYARDALQAWARRLREGESAA